MRYAAVIVGVALVIIGTLWLVGPQIDDLFCNMAYGEECR